MLFCGVVLFTWLCELYVRTTREKKKRKNWGQKIFSTKSKFHVKTNQQYCFTVCGLSLAGPRNVYFKTYYCSKMRKQDLLGCQQQPPLKSYQMDEHLIFQTKKISCSANNCSTEWKWTSEVLRNICIVQQENKSSLDYFVIYSHRWVCLSRNSLIGTGLFFPSSSQDVMMQTFLCYQKNFPIWDDYVKSCGFGLPSVRSDWWWENSLEVDERKKLDSRMLKMNAHSTVEEGK